MKTYFDPERTSRRQRAASREGMVTTTFALDSEQYARLKALSDTTRVTRNTLVRQAIEEFLDRHAEEAAKRQQRENSPAAVKKRKPRLTTGRARK